MWYRISVCHNPNNGNLLFCPIYYYVNMRRISNDTAILIPCSQWGGTLFYLSNLIRNSKPLEYLGRNTIVVYMVHIFFLEAYQKLWIIYLDVPEGTRQTNVFIASIAILTLISSLICIFVLNSKYLRWMIGKK